MANDNDDNRPHANVKKKTDFFNQLKAMKASKCHFIDLHMTKLDKVDYP